MAERIKMIKKDEIVNIDEINNIFTGKYNKITIPEEYNGELIKAKRVITPNVASQYTLYKSMGKWFIDDYALVLNKLADSCNEELTIFNYDIFEYYLYLGGNNLQRAKKLYIKSTE